MSHVAMKMKMLPQAYKCLSIDLSRGAQPTLKEANSPRTFYFMTIYNINRRTVQNLYQFVSGGLPS
jgi:hypothetical protein